MALPLFIAALGAGLSAVSTIAGGVQSARANAAQQQGAQIEAAMARLRGKQIGKKSREDLLTLEGNIDAIRSTRGVSLDSQTGQMIGRRTRQDAYRSEGIAVLGELNRAGNADAAARGYGTAAKWAIPLSVLNAAGSAAQSMSYARMAGR